MVVIGPEIICIVVKPKAPTIATAPNKRANIFPRSFLFLLLSGIILIPF